jgi:hypothetical protein
LNVPAIPQRAEGEGVAQRSTVVVGWGSVVVVRVVREMVDVIVVDPVRVMGRRRSV